MFMFIHLLFLLRGFDRFFIVFGSLALLKGDRSRGTARQAIAEAVAEILAHQLCLAVHHFDGAFVARCRAKSAEIVLLKPSTYMNLSGNAVRYWLQQEKIPVENMLVLVDDLNLPFGSIRMRKQGSNGGHNGLGHIQQVLGTQNYARLRFGIGNDFSKGAQCNFVLGQWSEEEQKTLPDRLKLVSEIIPSFCLQGMDRTMNQYNGK